ncbi:MAG: aldo/keto reductase [Ruminococcus sp.]|nr:aldo/keto reductase [Ruminococcus sp.]
MKKIISVFVSAIMYAFVTASCGMIYEPSAQTDSTTTYTTEDLNNLQDFILTKETSGLEDKDYDLNGDNRWDSFDVGLMRKELSDIPTKNEEVKINIEVNGNTLTATLENNSSAEAFVKLIESAPLTVDMDDYGNFEKVGSLGTILPRNDEKITTQAGDIILYQGNQITIYYDENTWNFTKLGKIDNITQSELKEILGAGSVSVTFSTEKKSGIFDMINKSVVLNSGYTMPINGLGTYSLHGEECINAVKSAIKDGVRLIDTASAYGNEEEVGQAIRESIEELNIKREDIFVTTKIYPGTEMANPEESIKACLDRLDIGYVDMMLLHHPDKNDVKAYKAMEKFVESGEIRSLGLSNWYVDELTEFLPQINITPALVQNEIHPYYQENDVIPYIQNLGIVVQGWYPLGGRGHTKELLSDAVISEIAENHNVSSAQVILRWNLQKGVVVIPGSSNPEHIRENTELYHFALSDEEMEKINALDRNEKHDWY